MFYEMVLTMKLVHLTCRKVPNNFLQEKEDASCSEEKVMKIQDSLQ